MNAFIKTYECRLLAGNIARFGRDCPALFAENFGVIHGYASQKVCRKKTAGGEIWGKIEGMPYILEHLSSLRQEITDLRNMNARHTGKGSDHQIDESAVEMRANRLVEIKKELSQMLNRPEDPAVWWEKGGRRNRVA
jgi:hypothetical protein